MEEKLYGGYSLKQFASDYKKFSSKQLVHFAEVFDKMCEAFGINGDLFKIIYKDGTSKTGIIRNFNYVEMGCKPLIADLEIQSPDFIKPSRFFQDKSKIIKINLMDVQDIIFLKEGNEKLSEKEQEFVTENIKKGKSAEETEKMLETKNI